MTADRQRGDRHFRVIDTGIRDGRSNIAFDRALIEARKEEKIPDTIRFLRFRPAALVKGIYLMDTQRGIQPHSKKATLRT